MARQISEKTIVTLGLVAVAGAIVYKPLKKIFETLGLAQSEAQQQLAQEQAGGQKSAFSPNYWRKFKKAKILTKAQADAKATKLYESITYTGPKYDTILAIFKTLLYKTQVSYLAAYFAAKYKVDLLDYLQNGKSNFLVHNALRDDSLKTILDLVSNMKTGDV